MSSFFFPREKVFFGTKYKHCYRHSERSGWKDKTYNESSWSIKSKKQIKIKSKLYPTIHLAFDQFLSSTDLIDDWVEDLFVGNKNQNTNILDKKPKSDHFKITTAVTIKNVNQPTIFQNESYFRHELEGNRLGSKKNTKV